MNIVSATFLASSPHSKEKSISALQKRLIFFSPESPAPQSSQAQSSSEGSPDTTPKTPPVPELDISRSEFRELKESGALFSLEEMQPHGRLDNLRGKMGLEWHDISVLLRLRRRRSQTLEKYCNRIVRKLLKTKGRDYMVLRRETDVRDIRDLSAYTKRFQNRIRVLALLLSNIALPHDILEKKHRGYSVGLSPTPGLREVRVNRKGVFLSLTNATNENRQQKLSINSHQSIVGAWDTSAQTLTSSIILTEKQLAQFGSVSAEIDMTNGEFTASEDDLRIRYIPGEKAFYTAEAWEEKEGLFGLLGQTKEGAEPSNDIKTDFEKLSEENQQRIIATLFADLSEDRFISTGNVRNKRSRRASSEKNTPFGSQRNRLHMKSYRELSESERLKLHNGITEENLSRAFVQLIREPEAVRSLCALVGISGSESLGDLFADLAQNPKKITRMRGILLDQLGADPSIDRQKPLFARLESKLAPERHSQRIFSVMQGLLDLSAEQSATKIIRSDIVRDQPQKLAEKLKEIKRQHALETNDPDQKALLSEACQEILRRHSILHKNARISSPYTFKSKSVENRLVELVFRSVNLQNTNLELPAAIIRERELPFVPNVFFDGNIALQNISEQSEEALEIAERMGDSLPESELHLEGVSSNIPSPGNARFPLRAGVEVGHEGLNPELSWERIMQPDFQNSSRVDTEGIGISPENIQFRFARSREGENKSIHTFEVRGGVDLMTGDVGFGMSKSIREKIGKNLSLTRKASYFEGGASSMLLFSLGISQNTADRMSTELANAVKAWEQSLGIDIEGEFQYFREIHDPELRVQLKRFIQSTENESRIRAALSIGDDEAIFTGDHSQKAYQLALTLYLDAKMAFLHEWLQGENQAFGDANIQGMKEFGIRGGKIWVGILRALGAHLVVGGISIDTYFQRQIALLQKQNIRQFPADADRHLLDSTTSWGSNTPAESIRQDAQHIGELVNDPDPTVHIDDDHVTIGFVPRHAGYAQNWQFRLSPNLEKQGATLTISEEGKITLRFPRAIDHPLSAFRWDQVGNFSPDAEESIVVFDTAKINPSDLPRTEEVTRLCYDQTGNTAGAFEGKTGFPPEQVERMASRLSQKRENLKIEVVLNQRIPMEDTYEDTENRLLADTSWQSNFSNISPQQRADIQNSLHVWQQNPDDPNAFPHNTVFAKANFSASGESLGYDQLSDLEKECVRAFALMLATKETASDGSIRDGFQNLLISFGIDKENAEKMWLDMLRNEDFNLESLSVSDKSFVSFGGGEGQYSMPPFSTAIAKNSGLKLDWAKSLPDSKRMREIWLKLLPIQKLKSDINRMRQGANNQVYTQHLELVKLSEGDWTRILDDFKKNVLNGVEGFTLSIGTLKRDDETLIDISGDFSVSPEVHFGFAEVIGQSSNTPSLVASSYQMGDVSFEKGESVEQTRGTIVHASTTSATAVSVGAESISGPSVGAVDE